MSGSGIGLTLAERWNGSSWAVRATPNPAGATQSFLNAVSCISATACTAVGIYTDSGGNNLTLAERWDGSNWAIQATPNPSVASASYLLGLSCTAATACIAVGDYLNSGVSVTSGTRYMTLAERWG
jgi:hypothetical protein